MTSSPIRRIYLDQNAWIQLARQNYGRANDPRLADALQHIRHKAESGRTSYPLSGAHYIETIKRGDAAARRRLGTFMMSIAGTDRIADATQVLVAEVNTALCAENDLPTPPPASVFGRGFAHVFPEAGDPYSTPTMSAAIERWGRGQLESILEAEMLTGPPFQLPAQGIGRPDDAISQRQLDFEHDTSQKIAAAGNSKDFARRLVLAQEALDLIEPLQAFLGEHDLDPEAYRTQERLTRLLLRLPAKGTVTRMRWTAHQNPNFKWSIGDLHDLTALGMAAGYCDVIVCEKHWGSVLKRHDVHLRATILTDIRQLPALEARAT